MADMKSYVPRVPRRTQLGLGAAVLLAIGAAGGAGSMSLARPTVEMAPTVATAIAKLPESDGVVTVKGHVAEVYGSRFVVQDASGRAMVDAGRGETMTAGMPVTVQGRYADGQLRASYLVDSAGQVEAVGPRGPHDARGPENRGPRGDGPPPPPPGGPEHGPGSAGPGAPPTSPPGCAPARGPEMTPPPPAANGTAPAALAVPAASVPRAT